MTHEAKTDYSDLNSIELGDALKVGLVLGGGGSRGAYQVGAYRFITKHLKTLGIKRLHCISGASIGALNGLLFATCDDDEIREQWMKMGSLSPSEGRSRFKKAVVTLTVLTLSPILALIGCSIIFCIVPKSQYFFLAAFLFSFFAVGIMFVLEDLGLVFNILDFESFNRFIEFRLSPKRMDSIRFYLVLGLFLSFWWFTAHVWPFDKRSLFDEGWVGYPKFTINVLAWVLLLVISLLCWRRLEELRKSAIEVTRGTGFFDGSKLTPTLLRLSSISPSEWCTRLLFATVARKGSYFDPERNAAVFTPEFGPPPPDGSWVDDELLPIYVDLGKASVRERISALALSTAIPFLFPNLVKDGNIFYDGGCADNEPIFPAIIPAHCDLIIVVRLNPAGRSNSYILEHRLTQLWKKCETHSRRPSQGLDIEAQWAKAREIRSSLFTEEAQQRNPANYLSKTHFIYVTPSVPLGWPLSFNQSSFEKLEQLGYSDATRQLPGSIADAIALIKESRETQNSS